MSRHRDGALSAGGGRDAAVPAAAGPRQEPYELLRFVEQPSIAPDAEWTWQDTKSQSWMDWSYRMSPWRGTSPLSLDGSTRTPSRSTHASPEMQLRSCGRSRPSSRALSTPGPSGRPGGPVRPQSRALQSPKPDAQHTLRPSSVASVRAAPKIAAPPEDVSDVLRSWRTTSAEELSAVLTAALQTAAERNGYETLKSSLDRTLKSSADQSSLLATTTGSSALAAQEKSSLDQRSLLPMTLGSIALTAREGGGDESASSALPLLQSSMDPASLQASESLAMAAKATQAKAEQVSMAIRAKALCRIAAGSASRRLATPPLSSRGEQNRRRPAAESDADSFDNIEDSSASEYQELDMRDAAQLSQRRPIEVAQNTVLGKMVRMDPERAAKYNLVAVPAWRQNKCWPPPPTSTRSRDSFGARNRARIQAAPKVDDSNIATPRWAQVKAVADVIGVFQRVRSSNFVMAGGPRRRTLAFNKKAYNDEKGSQNFTIDLVSAYHHMHFADKERLKDIFNSHTFQLRRGLPPNGLCNALYDADLAPHNLLERHQLQHLQELVLQLCRPGLEEDAASGKEGPRSPRGGATDGLRASPVAGRRTGSKIRRSSGDSAFDSEAGVEEFDGLSDISEPEHAGCTVPGAMLNPLKNPYGVWTLQEFLLMAAGVEELRDRKAKASQLYEEEEAHAAGRAVADRLGLSETFLQELFGMFQKAVDETAAALAEAEEGERRLSGAAGSERSSPTGSPASELYGVSMMRSGVATGRIAKSHLRRLLQASGQTYTENEIRMLLRKVDLDPATDSFSLTQFIEIMAEVEANLKAAAAVEKQRDTAARSSDVQREHMRAKVGFFIDSSNAKRLA